jgi:1-acyl-sn-glycerol-3-phosphate acyltransferase
MAQRSGCPIVPVGLRGTYRAMPSGTWRVDPGPLEVHFGAPIEPAELEGLDRAKALGVLWQRVAELADLKDGRYPLPGEKGESDDDR